MTPARSPDSASPAGEAGSAGRADSARADGSPGPVREIDIAPELEALAALTPAHYRESFTVALDPAARSAAATAEQWARLVLEHAPRTARAQMVTAWTLLGIPLAPPWSRSQVLGWRILHNAPTAIVLESRAAVGVTARLVFHVSETQLTQAMLVRYNYPPGRYIWSRLAPKHRSFIRALLSRAGSTSPA